MIVNRWLLSNLVRSRRCYLVVVRGGWGCRGEVRGYLVFSRGLKLSEIYDFPLGFWKWRLWGRIVFYVLIVERPFGAESSNDFVSGEGCPCSPWPLRTEGWKCLSLTCWALSPKLGSSELCPLLGAVWGLGERALRMELHFGTEIFPCCTELLWSVPVRGQESFWMSVSLWMSICVYFLPFPSVVFPVNAMCYLVFVGYDFEGSLNTSHSLSIGFVCLKLSRWLQLLSVQLSQSVQNLDFAFLSLLDPIRCRV